MPRNTFYRRAQTLENEFFHKVDQELMVKLSDERELESDEDALTIACGIADRKVLDELLAVVDEFQRHGFEPFQQYWCERDVFAEREVRIVGPKQELQGVVKGVNRKGELMLRTERGMETVTAGEISVRAAN